MKKLSTRIWALIVVYVMVTIVFMYILTDFLYEQLYVEDSKASMIEVGEKLQSLYKSGKVSDEFVEKIEQYNMYSNFNVFAVRNPRELSACVPFEIDYHSLIGSKERSQLLLGESITKIGYEERFGRQIISVILPLKDQNRLEGIIYLYYPLAKISELANKEVTILIGSAILFSFILALLVYKGLQHILKPLNELKHAAKKMSEGDYETRVNVTSEDEIGKLSQAFNDMARAIQREDDERKVFLATVSHELRTPISYVKGYSEAIQQQFIEGQERDGAMELIIREANRMERLTNELLQLARVKNESHDIEFYPIVLSETIRDATKLLENQVLAKQITVHLSLDETIIIEGIEEKVKQVFINVIENAIRYSEVGSTVKISSKIGKENNAIIEIKDSGIGIPEKDLPHITKRFYRVNKARSRADGGSGLGLSIVEQLVKQHQGSLTINSKIGEGTVVTMTFPIMEE